MKKCRKVKISAFLCWNATVTVQWGTIKLPLEYLVITIAKKNPFISAKISGNKSEEWQEIYSLKVPRIYSEYIMRKIRTVNKSGRQSWPNWSWRGCTVTLFWGRVTTGFVLLPKCLISVVMRKHETNSCPRISYKQTHILHEGMKITFKR